VAVFQSPPPLPKVNISTQQQSAALDKAYQTQYNFQLDPTPPSASQKLNDSLLGPNKYCALGFEPINFNTGNFLLQARDIYLPDMGTVALALTRTYNGLSNQINGPMGARWSFNYGQALAFCEDGSVGYLNDGGALFYFDEQPDGAYQGNDYDFRRLTKSGDGAEYLMHNADGSIQAFGGESGLLKWMASPQGTKTTIERDSFDAITGIVAPSGAKLSVESDHLGRITGVTTPLGLTTSYVYDDEGMLLSVRDPAGYEIRYEYDEMGRMTAWYDKNGTRQVLNEYDGQGRVVYQVDAKGGEYTLAYQGDHTVTTDAEGNASTIYFDDQYRATRIVDANGGETNYLFNDQGTISGVTDALGQLTYYEYDDRGNLTKTVMPNGATVTRTYDESARPNCSTWCAIFTFDGGASCDS